MKEHNSSSIDAARNILDKITVIDEKHKYAKSLYQDCLAPDFRLFNLVKTDEVALSKYLSLLLNPKGTHGQGEFFIRSFFNKLDIFTNDNFERVSISIEETITSGRLDLLIKSGEHLIGIENKPWAVDQPEQLSRYAHWLASQAKSNEHWKLIYLCNNDIDESSLPASTPEALKENVIKVPFSLITEWLNECSPSVKAHQVRYFVDELSIFVDERINGYYKLDKNMKEITDLALQSQDNFRAALLVHQNISEIKKQAWENFIDNLRVALCNDPELGVYSVEHNGDDFLNGRRDNGFWISFHEYSDFVLMWHFDKSNFLSLSVGFLAYEDPEANLESKKKIAEAMNKLFPNIAGSDSEWWSWWTFATNLHDHKTFNFGNDIDSWMSLISKDDNSFLAEVIAIVRKVKENIDIELLKKKDA